MLTSNVLKMMVVEAHIREIEHDSPKIFKTWELHGCTSPMPNVNISSLQSKPARALLLSLQ
jgi:hypothetical protein